MKSIYKYLEDKKFIQWVFNSGPELDEWWKSFEAENPAERENIRQARNILQKLRTTNRQLTEDEKVLLFSKILRQVEEQQPKRKSRSIITGILKYAAVALLFFLIGALLFYKNDPFNLQFYTQELTAPINTEEAKLMRAGSEDILLQDKNSKIEYRQNGQVVINNNVFNASAPERKDAPEINQLVIPYGKTSEITLSDGTKVWLNAGSRLVYPNYFADKSREVFLVGEAYFEVAHNAAQPFVVQTTDIRIRVLGTHFNISAYPSDNIIETVLAEGRVRLEQNTAGIFSESKEIHPGQLASFSKTERTTQVKEVDTKNYILWKEGLLRFESTDLSRVVKKLERYYNIRFSYDNPFLGGIKITGKLELNHSCESVLNNIATVASVEINNIGDGYYEISR